jgi:hypothetical protein
LLNFNYQLVLPNDLYNQYFMPAYRDTGARLFSSSWGAEEKIYSDSSRDTDKFANDYPDFLPIFAAGNYGETGMLTLCLPMFHVFTFFLYQFTWTVFFLTHHNRLHVGCNPW